jgi:hypothetical protein
MFFLFFKLIISVAQFIRIKNQAEVIRSGKIKIVKAKGVSPCSFFHYIFLPDGWCNELIIEHEKAHIHQLHWVDLLFAELVSLLLWFNPFVFLYKNALKLQHEYLTDSEIVKNETSLRTYLECMLQQVETVSFSHLTNHFYCKTIKKRIIMITKNKTSKKHYAVYLLALPIIGLLAMAFTTKNIQSRSAAENQSVSATSAYDLPAGWFKAGDTPKSYDMGIDKGAGPDGGNAATINSIDKDIKGFGTLMQDCLPDKYWGKRVRMSAYVKTQYVAEWAGLWFRIDRKDSYPLGFDNMKGGKTDRSIKGTTDWKKYEIVLDVPPDAYNLAYGALISGIGQIWFTKINFEIVDDSVPTTGRDMQISINQSQNKEPLNLDFKN